MAFVFTENGTADHFLASFVLLISTVISLIWVYLVRFFLEKIGVFLVLVSMLPVVFFGMGFYIVHADYLGVVGTAMFFCLLRFAYTEYIRTKWL